MSEYNVSIYAVVRVKIPVTAADHASAIKTAEATLRDKYRDEFTMECQGMSSEFAEDDAGFLVDEVGDDEYLKSKWYCHDGVTEAEGKCMACGIDK